MKQTWKQIFRAVLLALSVLLCTACPAWAQAQEEVDEDMRITLTSTAESLSQTIVELSQEEIDDYRESGDEFTVNTMEVWENSRKELGEFESMGESMVEKTTTGYSVKIPAQFSERNAEIVYLFDQTGVPISFSMDIQYPLSALLKRAGMNTLMGLGIVFAMLIFLTLVISLFRFIGKKEEKPQKEIEDLPRPAQAQRQSRPVDMQENLDDQELIAVIAGAIAAYEGTSTDSFVVRSIRKSNRRKTVW